MSHTVACLSALSACLLVACAPEAEVDPEETGGGASTTPGLGIPDGCWESRREPVADLSVAPDGFAISAEEAIAEVAGEWAGTAVATGAPDRALAFSVAHDGGPVEAVYLEYRSFSGGTGVPLGAPSSTVPCEPRYAFGVVTSLDVTDLLQAEGAGATDATAGWTSFTSETPLEEVSGGAAPGFDPADWDRVALAASFQLAEADTARLDVWWSGSNEEQAAPLGSGTGTVSTGTVQPSGVSESVLGAELVRLPAP